MSDILGLLADTIDYAIGRASMCYKQIPVEEYDAEKARQISDDLKAAVREAMMEAGLGKALNEKGIKKRRAVKYE